MELPAEPFDRERQDLDLVAALLTPEATAVYLDTSALVWLYRIREKARAELVTFLGKGALRERSHIPSWSLHELNKHRKSPKTLFPLVEQHGLLVNAIEQIKSNARLFVDDKFAKANGWPAANDYLIALDDAAEAMAKVAKPLNKAAEVQSIDAELAPFLRNHALRRPLPELAPLRAEFIARCEGRLPPGYEDRSKGADRDTQDFAGANRFGDYVFWRCVIEHAAANNAIKTVVIVSHDAKPDWVHYPANYIGYGEKKTSNNKTGRARVTCPQPILSFEIGVQAGVEHLHIVSIMQLVSAFAQTGNGSDFKELARAIQIDQSAEAEEANSVTTTANDSADTDIDAVMLSNSDAANVHDENQPVGELPSKDVSDFEDISPGLVDDLAVRLAKISEIGLADARYVSDPSGSPEANKVIYDLKTHNWYVQNPAVLQCRQIMASPSTSDTQLFVIGRNLYQAACGSAFRAIEFLPTLARLRGEVQEGAVDLVLAGALHEAYFNSHGAIRAKPKYSQLAALFDLVEMGTFDAVATSLHERLAPVMDSFVIIPGGLRSRACFRLDIDSKPLGISVEGVEITEAAMLDNDGWHLQGLSNLCTNELMTETLAEHFCLPENRVDIDPPITGVLDFHHLRLKPWSTDGALRFPGGLAT